MQILETSQITISKGHLTKYTDGKDLEGYCPGANGTTLEVKGQGRDPRGLLVNIKELGQRAGF